MLFNETFTFYFTLPKYSLFSRLTVELKNVKTKRKYSGSDLRTVTAMVSYL